MDLTPDLEAILDVQPPVRPVEPPTPGLRLNLGCGHDRKEGWVDVDRDPAVEPDVCADVAPYLAGLGDSSVDEIYAGHLLEHLDYEDGVRFLAECFRVLKPGGRLGVVVPDTRAIMRSYLEEGRDLDDLCKLFLYSTVQPSHHRWSYDLDTLGRALERAGFDVAGEIHRFEDPRLYGGAWWQCGLDGVRPGRRGRLAWAAALLRRNGAPEQARAPAWLP